jgi:hypothetical protein
MSLVLTPSLLILGLQIALGIHAYRTGRMNPWLWLIVFVPFLGCLLYVILELVPEWTSGATARRLRAEASATLDPGRRYREAARAVEIAPTVQNKLNLAEEALRLNRSGEAVRLYEESAVGIHASEPGILLGLARARFVAGDAGGALAAIQSLRAANPEHHKPDTDLLFARALEATGRTEEALAAYAALADAYPGEEARARYAALLAKLGQVQESRQEYAEIIRRVDLQGPHYKKMQRPWYDAARSAAAP